MLTTQFEVADGRRFAPMWDEPSAKATFALEVLIPEGESAYSNMPVASTQPDGGGAQELLGPRNARVAEGRAQRLVQ